VLHRAIATLQDRLRPHLARSKDRLETLALLVVAMVSGRTVNLTHLASERPNPQAQRELTPPPMAACPSLAARPVAVARCSP
jgi:hypothetical protein